MHSPSSASPENNNLRGAAGGSDESSESDTLTMPLCHFLRSGSDRSPFHLQKNFRPVLRRRQRSKRPSCSLNRHCSPSCHSRYGCGSMLSFFHIKGSPS